MRNAFRNSVFVFAVAAIGMVGSERMFWYWADSPAALFEGALFYMLPAAAVLMAMRRFEVHSWAGLVLAVPLYAYVTEGAITPVVYSGGPTPFFPLWFTAWHGLLSFAVLFVVVRQLALSRRTWAMTGLSVALGAFWGTWLITSLLPEQLTDPDLVADHGVLEAMTPIDFAVYASMVTAFFIGAHVLLNHVWPRPTERLLARAERPLIGLYLLLAGAWTAAAPWALPMFVGLCWLQIRVLRRHRSERGATPTLLDTLRGPVAWRNLLPLTLLAPTAALSYWLWWSIEPSETVLNAMYYGTIAIQTIAAAALLFTAWRRTGQKLPIAQHQPETANFDESLQR